MKEKVKDWYRSKTLWANVAIIAAAIFADVGSLLSTGQALTLVGVANIVLRALTTHKVVWT